MSKVVGSNHLARGRLLFRQKRYALASKELRAATAADPSDPSAPATLALALASLGKAGQAVAAAREAVSRAPDGAYGYMALGYACWANGSPADAESAGREAIRCDPRSVNGHVLLAQLAEAREDPAAALRHSDDALTVDPFEERAATLKGNALLALGRTNEAVETFRAALGHAPDDADLHGGLGWAELHAGRPAEALGHLREALRLDPLSNRARIRLAEALRSRNPLYRSLFTVTVWLGRRDVHGRLLLVTVLGYFALLNVAVHWEWRSSGWIFAAGCAAFVLWMWRHLAVPLFDLFLQFDPVGRRYLTRRDRLAAWAVATCFAAGAAQAGLAVALPASLALACGSVTVVAWMVHRAFAEPPGPRRNVWTKLLAPAAAALDAGLTFVALTEVELLPERVKRLGQLASFVAFQALVSGGCMLSSSYCRREE